MSIYEYLKEYGNYTFLEEEFNEVDNVILSLISYVDFQDIVPGLNGGKVTLKDACDKFYNRYSKKEVKSNILAVRNASYLLKELSSTKRYKDLFLYNYSYKVTFDMQFGALCISLPDKSIYVSYEGTDSYISGWREDFMFSYIFPTSSQKEAISYLNKVVGLFNHKVYVGGHSKGGNLALVAAMFCNPLVRMKIKHVFNNDGPGLRKQEFSSTRYKKISKKLISYVPKSSFIGMLLRHSDNYIVVDSKNKRLMQHDATSWLVDGNKFKRSELSKASKKFEKGVISWLDKLDDEARKKFVDSLFLILKKAEINDINEFKQDKINSMIKILKETRNLNKETKNMMLSYFKNLYGEIK